MAYFNSKNTPLQVHNLCGRATLNLVVKLAPK